MRRIIVLSFLSLVLATLLVVRFIGTDPLPVGAQEATPPADLNVIVGQLAPIGQQFELLPGVDLLFLNEGQPVQAEGQSVVLYRVIFHGGEVPSHIHPGTTVLSVESGQLSWTLQSGTVRVTRPGAAPEEVTEPGTEILLDPGEGLAYNADVVHTARAAGDEPAVVLVTSLWEIGQPAFTLTDEHGTPIPMGTPAA